MLWKSKAMLPVAALAAFTFSSVGVRAATEAEITAALESLFKAGRSEAAVTLGTPTTEGDAVVYKDVTIKVGGATPADAKIGTLKVTGGDVSGGGLKATSISAAAVENVSDGTKLTIGNIEIANPDLAPPATPEATGKAKFDTLTVGEISVTEGTKPPVTIASVEAEASDYVGDYPNTVGLSIEGLVVDPAMADDGGAGAAQLKELGYDKVTLNIFSNGNWDQAAGQLTLEDLTIEGADMGSVSLSAVLGGFTPEVVAKLGQPNPPPELLSQITVSEASIGYEDASLAGRLLDKQAKDMGQPREAFVEQISAALPLMLTALQNPAFQEKVAAAAGAFLKEPKNIEISIAPDQPVPLATIVGAAQTAPQTLPDTLKADVTANEAGSEE